MKRRIELINIYIIQIIRVLGKITLLVTNPIYPQGERNTKRDENGYIRIIMGDPNFFFDDSKSIYLSVILDRMRLEHQQIP